jgi:hypothetical protein
VLDDNVVGEAVQRPGGKRFVFIHPDRFAQVVRAHKARPLAVAAFLHGVAVHELTHIDGKMGDGHDEEFIARREDLGAATGHLLPAIAVLVGKLLKVTEPESGEARKVLRMERQIAELRAALRDERGRAAAERVARGAGSVQAVPSQREHPGVPDERAERLLNAAVAVLRARPPAGVSVGYVETFVRRHREMLTRQVSRNLWPS